ncbi:C-myc promoter-binding protein [Halotydeus destructor]|nr:C-myc promoter-binding protein [Halotydeus destructor]
MEGRDLVDTNLVIDDLSQKADSDTGSHTGATPSQESLPDVSDANGSPWTSRLGTIKYTDLVKSAATTMASRLNEFKSTLASNTNSPAKSANTSVMSGTAAFISQWANMVAEKIPSQFSLEDEDWGSSNSLDGRRLSMAPSDEDSSEWSREANSARAASFSQNIPHSMFDDVEKHYASSLEHNRDSPKFVEIVMCSSCRCYTCSAVLFDEEIMEGWTADDSNLNTSCPHCNFSFVPLLSICFKNVSENEPLVSLEDSKNHTKRTDSEPFTVPYLSPLVLRKELETVMLNEGDLSLLNPAFVDDHPIIYWNVLWYFKRINVPSHLPGLILRSNNHKGYFGHLAETGSVDYRNVAVSCLWDNHKLHEDMRKPMYRIYTESNLQSPLLHALATEDKTVPMGLIKQIIKSVQCNDLTTPMNLLTNERLRATENKPNVQRYSYSVYRDLLFLTIVAIGRENIDEVSFDREYRRAFESISPNQQLSMSAVDKPPSVGAIFCRRFFKELELNPVY